MRNHTWERERYYTWKKNQERDRDITHEREKSGKRETEWKITLERNHKREKDITHEREKSGEKERERD